MLGNYNNEVAIMKMNIMAIFMLIGLIVIAIAILFALIFVGIKLSKKFSASTVVYFYLLSISVLIVAASFINFGWNRVILLITTIPILHFEFFIALNVFSLPKMKDSIALKLFAVTSYITYIMTYLMLPDGGDHGGQYVLFGQIQNEDFISMAYKIFVISAIFHLIFLILQGIELLRLIIKKKRTATPNPLYYLYKITMATLGNLISLPLEGKGDRVSGG